MTIVVQDSGGASFGLTLQIGLVPAAPAPDPAAPSLPAVAAPLAEAPAPAAAEAAPTPGPAAAPRAVSSGDVAQGALPGGARAGSAADGAVTLVASAGDAASTAAEPAPRAAAPLDLRALHRGADGDVAAPLLDLASWELAAAGIDVPAAAALPSLGTRGLLFELDGGSEAVARGTDDAAAPWLELGAVDAASAAAVTFTAGFVWWLTRSGGMLTMMLMGIPAWRHVDLMPVLARDFDEDPTNDRFGASDPEDTAFERSAFDMRIDEVLRPIDPAAEGRR